MTNKGANYQLTAITLGIILLGGTILGSTPFAFAEDDDDLKKRLKQLIDKIREQRAPPDDPPGGPPDDPPGGERDDRPEKCKGTQYGEICDDSAPSLGIIQPGNRDELQAGDITFVIKAKDNQTGIKKVEVFINNVFVGEALLVSGDIYELVVTLNDPGRYKAKVIATDNAGLTETERISFKIV